MKKKKGFHRLFTVYILICGIIILFCFQYYKNLHYTIFEESKGYLQEVATRIGGNIDRIIEDNYAALYTMASTVETLALTSEEDIRHILKSQQVYWDYQTILLMEETGKTYDLNGKEVFVTIDEAMREDILNQERAMSTTQVVNNKECIILSVPLNNVVIEGKKFVAMAASYDPAEFEKVLSMNSFNEQAYSQIILKSGTVVTRPTFPYALKSGYNIFTTIEGAKLDRDVDFEVVKGEILNDRSGQIGFELDGVRRYMVYTPIQPDEWYLLTFVPVSVVNEKSDTLLKVTLVLCGIIAFAFAGLVAALLYTFGNNKKKLERIAYVDEVTEGNTIQRFYELAEALLEGGTQRAYALVFSNFTKFKVLNEQLGRQNCDKILWHFNNFLSRHITSDECMGRLSSDNFCLLLKFDDEQSLMERLKSWYEDAEEYTVFEKLPWALPITEFGIYVIENRTLPFPLMIDRAKLALKESTGSLDGKRKYVFYDDKVRRQLFREKLLEDMMKHALDNREFKVYLQPKYIVDNETIGGAEALVRWESPEEGMIFPNEFIPLFEKNGFIVQLDLWVFEEVCRKTREWIDSGIQPVTISVNCSRVHFKDSAFLVPYRRIAEQYKIPKGQLEIELTESIVLENENRLTAIIDEIHDAGFACSMDDFGSGYSSLNLIQSIPVDTLKLDKIFFKEGTNSIGRTEAVVGSIVKMAKALHMQTVAEGVEHREQVEMLKRVECDFIQGYVFAKPMTIEAFEQLPFGTKIV